MEPLDPFVAAEAAGLLYVNDTISGIGRERVDADWVYRRPDGTPIDDEAERTAHRRDRHPAGADPRVDQPDPGRNILATGRVRQAGNRYPYDPLFRAVRDATKAHRMSVLGGAPAVAAPYPGRPLPRRPATRRALAAVVRLMDETLIRIGNEEYERQNHSYGITTLHDEHVHLAGDTMQFEFRASWARSSTCACATRSWRGILHECEELPGQELFRYVDDHGHVVHVDSADVNAYLRAATDATFTAKDFRTWGGSVTAATVPVGLGPPCAPTDAKRKIVSAIDVAPLASTTLARVARKSYVHPRARIVGGGCLVRRAGALRGERAPVGVRGRAPGGHRRRVPMTAATRRASISVPRRPRVHLPKGEQVVGRPRSAG